MKKIQFSIFIFLAFTFFSKQIKAQDEDCPTCGWYVDGVKTDKIDCYSFDKLQLVLKNNSAFDGYQNIYFAVQVKGQEFRGYAVKTRIAMKIFLKGDYYVYTVFAKEYGQNTKMQQEPFGYYANWPSNLNRRDLSFEAKVFGKKGQAKDLVLFGGLYGSNTTGYEETFDETGCKCYVKTPITTAELISKTYTLSCTNRMGGSAIKGAPEVDLNQPCSVPGNKVDFNSLGGASSNSGSGNVAINNTVIIKNEVTTTTNNNTSSSSTAALPSALKPLDKNKPGYFAEKDGAQISREGYKKGDALNGEVRVYTEGKIREISMYVNDQKNGISTLYYENGKVDMTGNYKNDEKDGEWKMYNDAGKLKETKKYLNGEVQD